MRFLIDESKAEKTRANGLFDFFSFSIIILISPAKNHEDLREPSS
ncbi:hypothetical protein LEP1GSC061_3642 [Leptospira wolffii serovar Khorat str. Khorat-H2]|nr:hypothetical protein LEP1GSC061_3642 [Leptospira wolffii serovar Khorat str. Khorat-H2]